MQTQVSPANPFALMIDPQAVVQAIERSSRLGRLQSQVHRPLDKPLIPRVGDDAALVDDDEDDTEE